MKPEPPIHTLRICSPLAGRVLAAAAALALVSAQAFAQPALHPDLAAADHIAGPDAPALHALLDGRMQEAQSLLRATLAQSPSDAVAHQLLCRTYYAQDQADPAVRECELATRSDPHSSSSFLWLGRAYGLKARHANPFAAFADARKVHNAFESAVQLDPANQDAIGDLADYDIEAPAVVGGGEDKARALAARILPDHPSTGHGILAALAESDHDLPTAEREFKLALSTAKGPESPAFAGIDLASFYARQNRPDDAVTAVRSSLALDRTHGPVLVAAATVLLATHREPALAEHCLKQYLASRAQTDAAPAFKVHLQLARLLAARGDSTAATHEIEAATQLAPGFPATRPAQGI